MEVGLTVMLYKLKTFFSKDVEIGAATRCSGRCWHLSPLLFTMSQRIYLTTKSRAICGWVLGRYSSVPFLASVPVCISWVIRGTRWVSVMRHQWEEQPRETKFFHLALDANKAKDELAADGSKALKVEIAIHSSLQWDRRQGFLPLFAPFPFLTFPLCQSFLVCAFKGRAEKAVQPTSLPRRKASWYPV